MEILAIKTNDGYFLKANKGEHLKRSIINDKEITETFHSDWVFSKTKPKKIELSDETLESEKIPLVIKKEDTLEDDKMAEWFCSLESLYIFKSDEQDPKLESVDFELNILFNIPEINFVDLDYPSSGQWMHKDYPSIKNSNIKHQELDRILFPSIILPERPCKLSSKDSYDLIRQHIRNNIDSKIAEITSNYDFCFAVEKKIGLCESEPYSINLNSGTKRKPKYEIRYRNSSKRI